MAEALAVAVTGDRATPQLAIEPPSGPRAAKTDDARSATHAGVDVATHRATRSNVRMGLTAALIGAVAVGVGFGVPRLVRKSEPAARPPVFGGVGAPPINGIVETQPAPPETLAPAQTVLAPVPASEPSARAIASATSSAKLIPSPPIVAKAKPSVTAASTPTTSSKPLPTSTRPPGSDDDIK
jgi:hypothetical protein